MQSYWTILDWNVNLITNVINGLNSLLQINITEPLFITIIRKFSQCSMLVGLLPFYSSLFLDSCYLHLFQYTITLHIMCSWNDMRDNCLFDDRLLFNPSWSPITVFIDTTKSPVAEFYKIYTQDKCCVIFSRIYLCNYWLFWLSTHFCISKCFYFWLWRHVSILVYYLQANWPEDGILILILIY